ncbi:MAG TPA: GNAT family N-acetyltransferase [Chloroflexota bacterium]|jgi:ribosomal protein S18 acetylase RimI-like enzyme|nr:GNAT family N-acetyltransferase [Chloroflexota bacterium]
MQANGNTRVEEAGKIKDPGTLQAYALGDAVVPPLPVPGIRFALLEPAQRQALAAAMHEPDSVVQARLREGGRAALALTAEGRIAGYGWIRYGAIQIDDLHYRLPLPQDHAYIWDCLTIPELRGRGIFPGLLRFMLEALRQEGMRYAWAGVAPGNVASLHAFARAGFHAVAHIGIVGEAVRLRMLDEARPYEVAILSGGR